LPQPFNRPPGPPRSGWVQPVDGANRRWRWQFRCRGSRHESAAAQLYSLAIKIGLKLELTIVFKEDWMLKKVFIRHFYFRTKVGNEGVFIWLPAGN
jgi:hypothetical protein